MISWDTIDDVLFDMDGTLLDLSWDLWFWLTVLPQEIATRHDIEIEEATGRVHTYSRTHKGSLQWYRLADWSHELGVDVEKLHGQHVHHIRIIPGAVSLVTQLRTSGKRVGIVTNADVCVLRQKQALFPDFLATFDFEVSSSELRHPKEDVRCWDALDTWLKERDRKPITRSRAFYADDNLSVLESLQRAGWRMENLLYLQQPEIQGEIRPKSDTFPSIPTLASLLTLAR